MILENGKCQADVTGVRKTASGGTRRRDLPKAKRIYPSQASILEAEAVTGLRGYRCQFCRYWHLTSKERGDGGPARRGLDG